MLTVLYLALPVLLTPASLLPPIAAQIEAAQPSEEASVEAVPPPSDDQLVAPSDDDELEAASVERDEAGLRAQLEQRARMRDVHRAFGIATWISMAGTVALGALQLRDEYGPFAATAAETPCARADAILGSCGSDFPFAHGISAIVTTALYYTTFTISFLMPDPLDGAASPGWAGERLRIHKTLRWVHLATMVATSLFGGITANIPQSALSFSERQALATTHFALGATSFALLSAAAIVVLF